MPDLNDDEYNEYKENFKIVNRRYPTPEEYEEIKLMTCSDAAEYLGKLDDQAYKQELERDYRRR